MSEFIKVLVNQRSLRAVLRELTFEQLTEVKEKLDALFQDREEAELKVMQEQEERQAKLAEFQAMLQEAGINPSELLGTESKVAKGSTAKSKRAPRPPKYKYTEDGVEKTWTGQGRMPKVLVLAIEAGELLESYAI
ncbi:H-NS family histone-like protein [Aeromonas popoffii]|uniref:H-NS family histone-like protein n=1 Tax=Aeromonas popoffii TaxID=70856 RepID=UPI0005A84370|nr:H-NS family nucleoid-associated regulatory protein [Aeromonas popoffii]